MRTVFVLILNLVFYFFLFAQDVATYDTVVVMGSFIMGENDSRDDAKQFALLDAKRKAIEQFGTYISSETTVENYQLTQDEIKTYTAGLMQTKILAEKIETEGQYMTMFVKIEAMIDPKDVEESLKNYRSEENSEDDLPDFQVQLDEITEKIASLKNYHDQPSKSSGTRRLSWKDFERTELLTQIVVESRKSQPNLIRMKLLTNTWLKKYPRAKFIKGYLGIAYYKKNKINLAKIALKEGIQNLVRSQKIISRKAKPKQLKLLHAQETHFKKYLVKCEKNK